MENKQEIVKIDNTKMIETINDLSLDDNDKKALIKQLMSDNVDIIKIAKEKLRDSGVAQADISNFLSELERLNKKGMYATTTLEAKTGSGKITMNFKGGDTKLIVPVLTLLGIIAIAIAIIIFWK